MRDDDATVSSEVRSLWVDGGRDYRGIVRIENESKRGGY